LIMKINKTVKTIIIIAALAALAFVGLKWFAGFANDDLGSYDGGRGKYEDTIENG